jgi:hypothetical protein
MDGGSVGKVMHSYEATGPKIFLTGQSSSMYLLDFKSISKEKKNRLTIVTLSNLVRSILFHGS